MDCLDDLLGGLIQATPRGPCNAVARDLWLREVCRLLAGMPEELRARRIRQIAHYLHDLQWCGPEHPVFYLVMVGRMVGVIRELDQASKEGNS